MASIVLHTADRYWSDLHLLLALGRQPDAKEGRPLCRLILLAELGQDWRNAAPNVMGKTRCSAASPPPNPGS